MNTRISRYRFHCLSLGLVWTGFSGNILHSGLGVMLKRHAPSVFDALYGEQGNGDSRPRAWWMQPPLETRSILAPQDHFYFELSFCNMQPGWLQACVEAIVQLGEAGVGKERGKFTLERIDWVHSDGTENITDLNENQDQGLDELFMALRPPHVYDYLGLELITPLRIKTEQGYVRHAPELSVILSRLISRVSQLTGLGRFYLPGVDEMLSSSQQAQIVQEQLVWDDLNRYSVRQAREMPMGGLRGHILYACSNAGVYPWLALGEWLQLGTKTTFGLGVYRISPPRTL